MTVRVEDGTLYVEDRPIRWATLDTMDTIPSSDATRAHIPFESGVTIITGWFDPTGADWVSIVIHRADTGVVAMTAPYYPTHQLADLIRHLTQPGFRPADIIRRLALRNPTRKPHTIPDRLTCRKPS